MKVIAINGSPRMKKGHTALLLSSFIQGMTDTGAEVELFYARRLKITPALVARCTAGIRKPENVASRMICSCFIPNLGKRISLS